MTIFWCPARLYFLARKWPRMKMQIIFHQHTSHKMMLILALPLTTLQQSIKLKCQLVLYTSNASLFILDMVIQNLPCQFSCSGLSKTRAIFPLKWNKRLYNLDTKHLFWLFQTVLTFDIGRSSSQITVTIVPVIKVVIKWKWEERKYILYASPLGNTNHRSY